MKRKLMLGLLFLILFSSFVCGTIQDNDFYTFYKPQINETNQTLTTGNTFPPFFSLRNWADNTSDNLLVQNQVTLINDINESVSFEFDGSGDVLRPNFQLNDIGTNNYTVSLWVNVNVSSGTTSHIIGENDNANFNWRIWEDNNNFRFLLNGDATGSSAFTDGVWYNLIFTYDNGAFNFYQNNVSVHSGTQVLTTHAIDMTIGGRAVVWDLNLDGFIDGVSVFNRSLTPSEVEFIYTQGRDYNQFEPVTNFVITALDNQTATSILNFTANVSGTIYESNNTGSITTTINDSQIVNITLSSDGYLSNTYLDYNTSTNLIGVLEPLDLLDFTLITPNNSITSNNTFNITYTEAVSPTGKTVNYTINTYFSDGNLKESFSTENLSYLLNITNYASGIYTIEVNATELGTNESFKHNSTLSIDFLNFILFQDTTTSNPLTGKTVTVTYPSSYILNLTTDVSGNINFSSFIGENFEAGNYSITLESVSGFVTPITFTEEIDLTNSPLNLTFNISQTTINVNLFYRSNGTTFNKLANVVLQEVFNATTSNGSVSFNNISIVPGNYTLVVASDGFGTESKLIEYTSQDDLSITMFLVEENQTNTATVTVRAVDGVKRALPGASITLKEYDEDSKSYEEVSECITNSDGECIFFIEVNTKSYIISGSKILNDIVLFDETDPEIFKNDISGGQEIIFSEQIRTLVLRSTVEFIVSPILFLEYNIVERFSNTSNISSIVTTFSTTDGHSTKVCTQYYKLVGGIKQNISNGLYCAEGASGTVTPDLQIILNRSFTYIAEVYMEESGIRTILESFRYNSINSLEELFKTNAIAKPFILWLWIGILSLGFLSKKMTLFGGLAIVLSWIEPILFTSFVIISVSVFKTVLALIFIYNARKKEDFQ